AGGWLEGDGAIDAILAMTGDPPALIPDEAKVDPAGDQHKANGHARTARDPWAMTVKGLKFTGTTDAELAAEALSHLGSTFHDDYDQWIKVGMALYGLGAAGLA